MLLPRSFVATGTGNSAGLVEKSSKRCTGNVVVSASSNVEVVVIVVVVSSVGSVGELSTISILSRDILLFEIDKLFFKANDIIDHLVNRLTIIVRSTAPLHRCINRNHIGKVCTPCLTSSF